MDDSKLVTEFCAVLNPWIRRKYPDINIVQKPQPTAQGVPTEPVVYLQKLTDHRDGFARTDYGFQPKPGDNVPDGMISTNTVQVITSRMQFSGLWRVDPNLDLPPTAADLLRHISLLLSVDVILAQLREKGLNLLRIVDVHNPYFTDDTDEYAAFPTFDVIVQHHDEFQIDIARFTSVEAEIKAV